MDLIHIDVTNKNGGVRVGTLHGTLDLDTELYCTVIHYLILRISYSYRSSLYLIHIDITKQKLRR